MKKTVKYILLIAVLTIASASCRRDPIVYPVSNYYVTIDTDASPSETAGTAVPTLYSVNFYETGTGKRVLHTFIRPDYHPEGMPKGGYVSGLEPGEYDIVVYNYDTSNTIVESDDWISRIYARTDNYGYNSGVPIIKMPDHLYVYAARVQVPFVTESDGVYIIDTDMKTVIEDWTISVTGIQNMSDIEGISFYISGQERGRYIGPDGKKFHENAIIMFPGFVTKKTGTKADGDADENLSIVVPYTTFGRYDNDVRVMVTMVISGPDGSTYYHQKDVSEEMDRPDHRIDIEADIDVRNQESGGFNPHAEEWDPETFYIELS